MPRNNSKTRKAWRKTLADKNVEYWKSFYALWSSFYDEDHSKAENARTSASALTFVHNDFVAQRKWSRP